MDNDINKALEYAFDKTILCKNKAVLSEEEIPYTVERQGEWNGRVEINCPQEFDLRLDRLLSDQLGLSRSKVKDMMADGMIASDDGLLSPKTKVRGTFSLKMMTPEACIGAEQEQQVEYTKLALG